MTKITRTLDRKDVPAHLLTGYAGRQITLQIGGEVWIPATAGLWDGGSRETFSAMRLYSGMEVSMRDADPFDGTQRDRVVGIPPGVAIVRRSVFQGRDTGITFFIREDDAAPLLPGAADVMDEAQSIVLEATWSLKSSYRKDEAARHGVTAQAYDDAKAALIDGGYLTASGAITTKGKNAIPTRCRF